MFNTICSRFIYTVFSNWIITFMSDLGDVPQITPNDVQLTGPAAKMSSATRTQGIAPENLESKIITPRPTSLEAVSSEQFRYHR